MTIPRDVAKRQLAATRSLLAALTTCAMRPPGSAQDTESIREAFSRLTSTTDALARAIYAQPIVSTKD